MGMDTFLQDVKYAARSLRRAPGFALAVVLTLALGIGGTTAVFSVVYGLLLKPLPYHNPDRLVMVWQDWTRRGGPATEWATPGNYFDWKAERSLFAGITAVSGWGPDLTGEGEPEPLSAEQVTHDYFKVLGAEPVLGRAFVPDDDVPNAPLVTVLSHRLWQRRFGGDPGVIGRTVTLAGDAHQIVGVMPADFRPGIVATAELWRPLRLQSSPPNRGAVFLRVIGRLPPDLDLESARLAGAALMRRLEQQYPESNARAGMTLVPLHDDVVGNARLALLVMLGAVGFVLLIACVNVANLLLARASGRGREMAVRVALGAARLRIVRQLLTEAVSLALLGGAAGMLLAIWGISALVGIAPASAPRLNEVGLHPAVLVFAAAITMVTGLLFGLVPALHASRTNAAPALKDSGRGTTGMGGRRSRRVLVVAEVALALVLMTGSGLLLRTLMGLRAEDLGFEPRQVLRGRVAAPAARYPTAEQRVALYDALLARMRVLPGVEQAALSSNVPLQGGDTDMGFVIEGREPPREAGEGPVSWFRVVSASYFETMRIPLRQGRLFAEREPQPVVVINETLARRYWPGADPVGQRISGDGPDSPWFTIVGVVGDVKFAGARGSTRNEMYIPYWHLPGRSTNIVLRTSGPPGLLAGAVREAVRDVDGLMAVATLGPLDDMVARSVELPRFLATMVLLFALIAMALAAVGIYGVMAFNVTLRTAELGVRIALGAGRGSVLRLVLGDGLRLALAGVAIGAVGALLLGRAMSSLLFGVGAADPLTFTATSLLLLGVAMLAALLPARRAAAVDPMRALKSE